MSLSLTLTKAIDDVVNSFIKKVSVEYKLNVKELKNLWTENSPSQPIQDDELDKSDNDEPKSILTKIDQSINPDTLLKSNKAELIALCKANGHKCSGAKVELIARLLGKETETVKKTKTTSATKQKKVESIPVVKKLTANIPNILIRRNKFNNYEHPDSSLVFDNEAKFVIGKQNDDGTIDELTDDDIDQCNAFKFKFKIPTNLDGKETLDDVQIDELDEEEEEELDEEELVDDVEEEEEELDDDEYVDYYSDE